MKKLFAVLLAAMMLLAMVACGNRLSPTTAAAETGMAEQGTAIDLIKLF